jgi:hypothetical protein
MPAGLREYSEDKNGRAVEDEINDLYRGCLNVGLMLSKMNLSEDEMFLADTTILKLQKNVNSLYSYIIKLLDGKKKFIQGMWTKRAIDNATKNVISGLPIHIDDLREDVDVDINTTVCGLFQYIKAAELTTLFNLNSKFLSYAFSESSNMVKLFNPKTLKTVVKEISSKERDRWTTDDGLNNIMNKMIDDEVKNGPIVIDDHYLFLVYDDKDTIVVITDSNICDEFDEKKLRPITYGELFYLSIYDSIPKYPALVTRYPITGQGSIYPSKVSVNTTSKHREVSFYTNNINGMPKVIKRYPISKHKWLNSLSPHFTKLARLGGDYDGDKCSFTILDTEESINEINTLLNDPSFYIDPLGAPVSSIADDVVNYVILSMTK